MGQFDFTVITLSSWNNPELCRSQTFVSSGFSLFPTLRTQLDSRSLCSSLPWQLRLDKNRLKAVRLLQNWIYFISACTIESCSSPATLSPKNYPPIALFWILLLWSVTLCISAAVVKHSEHIKHRVWILYKGNKVCIYGELFPQWSPSVKFLIINNMSTNFYFIIDEWSSALVFFIEFLNVTKCSVMMREEENGKTGRMFPGCRVYIQSVMMVMIDHERGVVHVWDQDRPEIRSSSSQRFVSVCNAAWWFDVPVMWGLAAWTCDVGQGHTHNIHPQVAGWWDLTIIHA